MVHLLCFFDSDGTESSKSEKTYVLIWRKKAEEYHLYLWKALEKNRATDFKLNNQTCRFLGLTNLENMASQKRLWVCAWCGEDCDHHASPKWQGKDTRSPQNGKAWKNIYNENRNAAVERKPTTVICKPS